MKYEQQEFDLRLDYEKDLKSNLATVAKFTGEKMAADLEAVGRPLTEIRTKQEAYGVAAQQFVNVSAKVKALKGEMDDFLKGLSGDGEAVQIAGSLYNFSIELAQESIIMAAHANRILADLYYGNATPIEDYLAEQEEGDGFDEVGGDEE